MTFDNVTVDLATIFGIAALTFILMELIKRGLQMFWLKGEEQPRWYDFALYLSAYVVGIVCAFIGLVIIESQFAASSNAEAIVKGIIGGFVAVAGYSGWQNVKKLRGPQQE